MPGHLFTGTWRSIHSVGNVSQTVRLYSTRKRAESYIPRRGAFACGDCGRRAYIGLARESNAGTRLIAWTAGSALELHEQSSPLCAWDKTHRHREAGDVS